MKLVILLFSILFAPFGDPQDTVAQKIKDLGVESDLLFKEEKWEACVQKRREALELARQAGDKWYQAALSNNLGVALARWEKFDEAEQSYLEAMRLGLPDRDFTPLVRRTVDNIHSLAAAIAAKDGLGKSADAYGRLFSALESMLPYPIKREILLRTADACRESNQFDKASSTFDQIIALDTANAYTYGAAEMGFGKADVELRAKTWPQALNDLEAVIKKSQELNDVELEAWGHERLSELHMHQNDMGASERHLRRATDLFEKIKHGPGLARCYQVWIKLSEHRKAKDDIKKYTGLLASAQAMSEPERAPVVLNSETFTKSLADMMDGTTPVIAIENAGKEIVFKNILDPKPQTIWKTGIDYVRQPFTYSGYKFILYGQKVTLDGRTWFVEKGKSLYVPKQGDVLPFKP